MLDWFHWFYQCKHVQRPLMLPRMIEKWRKSKPHKFFINKVKNYEKIMIIIPMNTSLCLICFARVVALRISMSLFTGGRTLQFLGSLFLGLITPTINHSKTTSVIRSINSLEHWSTCLNNELTETDNTVIMSNSLLIYSNITD